MCDPCARFLDPACQRGQVERVLQLHIRVAELTEDIAEARKGAPYVDRGVVASVMRRRLREHDEARRLEEENYVRVCGVGVGGGVAHACA
jgi:hypothetical protein